MPSICIYFQVHQPIRLNRFNVFDIGKNNGYFADSINNFYLERVSRKCYIPTNQKILELIKRYEGNFRLSYSITGILIEHLEKHFPHVLDSFRKLVDTGCVELFSETYYHSLAFLISQREFKDQVKLHMEKVWDTFGVKPKIFRNTEAMFSNEIAQVVEKMGFRGLVAEGLQHILGWRSPNHLYTSPGSNVPVFLRNFKLSDDVGFRFSLKEWKEWPLTADKYASWLSSAEGETVNLFLDYETFGEHQWEDTGIFAFLEHLPNEALKYSNLSFKTPSEIIKEIQPIGEFDVPYISSWADIDRNLSAWLENGMQQHAFREIKALEPLIRKRKKLLDSWRKLQTSDHFYYMCTKWFADGDVHKYFNYYETPYDAFLNFMNVISDLKMRAGAK
jgi:alpha-amylase